MPFTTEQIENQYQTLPNEIKEAMLKIETADIVRTIGNKYALHVDQVGELADEIGLVMLGLTRPNEFVTHIIARIGVDHIVAEAIAKEVNEQIFLKIRESLQELPGDSAVTKLNGDVEPIPASPPPPETLPTDLPNRDEIIDGIENPKTTKEDTVFEQKMGKLFRIPREEIDLDPYNEKPE